MKTLALATFADSGAFVLGLFFMGLLLYFVPAIVAASRHHPQANAICVLNVFLGWTILGWIGALVWASTHVAAANVPQPPVAQPGALPAESGEPKGLLWKIPLIIFAGLLFLYFSVRDKPQTAATVIAPQDQASSLIFRCGTPTKDYSSEREVPRPLIVTRTIEYGWANLRLMFVPDGEPTSLPHKWKLSLMSNMKGKSVTAKDALLRLPCSKP